MVPFFEKTTLLHDGVSHDETVDIFKIRIQSSAIVIRIAVDLIDCSKSGTYFFSSFR